MIFALHMRHDIPDPQLMAFGNAEWDILAQFCHSGRKAICDGCEYELLILDAHISNCELNLPAKLLNDRH